jgi:hypothetical protein
MIPPAWEMGRISEKDQGEWDGCKIGGTMFTFAARLWNFAPAASWPSSAAVYRRAITWIQTGQGIGAN